MEAALYRDRAGRVLVEHDERVFAGRTDAGEAKGASVVAEVECVLEHANKLQNQLRFRALLADSAREVRFERVP